MDRLLLRNPLLHIASTDDEKDAELIYNEMLSDEEYISNEIEHIFRKDILAYKLDDIDDYVGDINYLNSECITDNWSDDSYTYIVESDLIKKLNDAMTEFKDLFHDEYGYYLEKYNTFKLSDFYPSYKDDDEDCNITIRVADHISNTYNFNKFNQDENYIIDIVFDTKENINNLGV